MFALFPQVGGLLALSGRCVPMPYYLPSHMALKEHGKGKLLPATAERLREALLLIRGEEELTAQVRLVSHVVA